MTPVPMTLQTLAVVIVGGWLPRSRALAAVAAYLLAALVGLPVLADFARAPGLSFLELRSCGYVLGFVPGALLAARIAGSASFVVQCSWALLAHAVILACGIARLAFAIGFAPAIEHGLTPFLPGAVVKSFFAVLAIRILVRAGSRQPVRAETRSS